jgi:hypothetical protein
MEVWLHAFLISALDGDEWPTSRPGRFTPGERTTQYPLNRRLGGLQSRSRSGGVEKNSQPLPEMELRPSSPYPSRYSDLAILDPLIMYYFGICFWKYRKIMDIQLQSAVIDGVNVFN